MNGYHKYRINLQAASRVAKSTGKPLQLWPTEHEHVHLHDLPFMVGPVWQGGWPTRLFTVSNDGDLWHHCRDGRSYAIVSMQITSTLIGEW